VQRPAGVPPAVTSMSDAMDDQDPGIQAFHFASLASTQILAASSWLLPPLIDAATEF
jgi:hypothetical protein